MQCVIVIEILQYIVVVLGNVRESIVRLISSMIITGCNEDNSLNVESSYFECIDYQVKRARI